MVHVVDPSYKPPSNENAPIWHYRTFEELQNILDKESLYCNQIGRTRAGMKEGQVTKKALDKFSMDEDVKLIKKFADDRGLYDSQKIIQSNHFINGWTMNNDESDRDWMWQVFTNDCPQNGVVIESTYKCLVKSLDNADPREIRVGQVQYFDPNDPFTSDAIVNRYIHKNLDQEREKEIRIVTTSSGRKILSRDLATLNSVSDSHVMTRVNLKTLIKKVYISTNHRKNLEEDVRRYLKKTIGESTFAGKM